MTHIKVNILSVNIDNINMDEAVLALQRFILEKKKQYSIFTPNVDFLIKAQFDNHFKNILNRADLLLSDGKPLIWASRFLGNKLSEKISGSSLFFKICSLSATKDYKIFLLGAEQGVASLAADNLKKRYNGLIIAGTYSPPFGFENNTAEVSKTLTILQQSKADILFVGMGAPKQEYFISKYKDEYQIPVSLGIGASIDFAAGIKKMPPEFIKNIGFAWLWRLLSEPKRLWKRYLIEDMRFFYYIFKQKYFVK